MVDVGRLHPDVCAGGQENASLVNLRFILDLRDQGLLFGSWGRDIYIYIYIHIYLFIYIYIYIYIPEVPRSAANPPTFRLLVYDLLNFRRDSVCISAEAFILNSYDPSGR